MIRFENVGVRYGLGAEVLRDVSFTLQPGTFSFLTGPSGAGKTTLLKLLYLALRPTRGLVDMFGQDVTHVDRAALPALRRRIGVVFQDFMLLDHMSALDNVAMPMRITGELPDTTIRAHVEELLNWVGLGERKHAKPPTLSGGEKQRVALARAVINQPRLLLADEPTGNLDPDMARRLMHLLVELNKLGTTMVIATHDLALAETIGGAHLELADGHVRYHPAMQSPHKLRTPI